MKQLNIRCTEADGEKLQEAFDAYVGKHGNFDKQGRRRLLGDFYRLCLLAGAGRFLNGGRKKAKVSPEQTGAV